MSDIFGLIKALSYEYKDLALLDEALRHSSFVNEQPESDLRDNERLEFLGDAVLNLAIGHILMQQNPGLKEGDLSRIRANLVNESQLAQIARDLNIGDHIQLGKGERQSDGHEKNSILANTFEAVIASIYLDGGFDAAHKIIFDLFLPLLDPGETFNTNQDFKSQLQERVQTTHKSIPSYTIVAESGPDHDKTFKVRMQIHDLWTEGTGKSKKMAEQAAAKLALEILDKTTSL